MKFKVTYGVCGQEFTEEIIECPSEEHAWNYANTEAAALVSASVERLSEYEDREKEVALSRAIDALLELRKIDPVRYQGLIKNVINQHHD